MITVQSEAEFEVAADALWRLVRAFDAMASWNPSVRKSRIEDGPPDRIGCLRVLEFDDGGTWTHRLTGLSDEDMRLQYRIVAGPPGAPVVLRDYRAEMLVEALTDRAQPACRLHWQAWFETDQPEVMQARARQVFAAGFEGLRRALVT
ncbi:MAG: SRPBCC family protein [Burkholderiales bacterium]|nr:SRPBCC family protein [Burkholderiales bacterium]